MLVEIWKYLEKSESIYDFADAVVIVRLRQTRDMYIEELDRLDNLKELSEYQKQDYEELSGDIAALHRVIMFYTWTKEED